MSQFSTNYEIPRTTGICAATGRQLEPGEGYYATLVDVPEPTAETGEGGDEAGGDAQAASAGDAQDAQPSAASALGLERLDVSLEAWQQGFRPQGLFSYWKSTVPEPNQKKRVFVDDAVLMNLFERLADAEQAERLAFRYVLGLILLRKRLLRFDSSERRAEETEQGQVEREYWTLTPKKDVTRGPMSKWDDERQLELLDPRLSEEQIQQVTEQLGQVLDGEL